MHGEEGPGLRETMYLNPVSHKKVLNILMQTTWQYSASTHTERNLVPYVAKSIHDGLASELQSTKEKLQEVTDELNKLRSAN